jgi:hypothetical protein
MRGSPAERKSTPMTKAEATKTTETAAVAEQGAPKANKGATMAEIAKATDWRNHSIRGFISGNLTKKMGLTVESGKNDSGERTYKTAK